MTVRKARPWQAESLRWGSRLSSVAYFMDLRLGKSISAIRHAYARLGRPLGPLPGLVLSPPSVIPNWEAELSREVRDLHHPDKVKVIAGTGAKAPSLIEPGTWHVCNFGTARAAGRKLLDRPWASAIVDESSWIRNPKIKITKRVLKWLDPEVRAILSGLPDPESILDYFTQMCWVGRGQFMGCKSYWQWRGRYFHRGWMRGMWLPNKHTEKLVAASIAKMSFQKRLDEVASIERIRTTRWVYIPARFLSSIKRLEKEMLFELEGREFSTAWILEKIIWQQRLADGWSPEEELIHEAKINALISILETELVPDEQLVVWFRFNCELYAVEKALRARKISCCKMLGGRPRENAGSNALFLAKKKRVMLAQIKSAKQGVDFSSARTACYFSHTWSFDDRRQSEDRILSLDEAKIKRPLAIIDLVAAKTIDEQLVKACQRKRKRVDTFNEIIKGVRERQ